MQSIKPISEHLGDLDKLADAYAQSYRKISAEYKEPVEMEAYDDEYFISRIKRFAAEDMCFVLSSGGDVAGFARFNDIPDYYKKTPHRDLDSQTLEGAEYNLARRIRFNEGAPDLDGRTAILNQIYLMPKFQKRGMGGKLVRAGLDEIRADYTHLIVEYNLNNHFAEGFYKNKLGMIKIADTMDFDGIIRGENGRPTFFISPVGIRWQAIAKVRENLAR
ncbi:MAG: GNAT family N-acetyltransferase [Rickettsiales bacterium]|jgi:GNAT superfamily N-acetyltransferase|nr:GNAT family N-acetyltransferase [Rickettsiales bacterium]